LKTGKNRGRGEVSAHQGAEGVRTGGQNGAHPARQPRELRRENEITGSS